MSDNDTAWVVPGAELIIEYRGAGRGRTFGQTHKIAKVHKTGRFTLEGDSSQQQYKPFKDGARRAGDHYSSSYLVPLTEETIAAVERVKVVKAARVFLGDEVERISKLLRSSATDDAEILREAEYMHMLERYRAEA